MMHTATSQSVQPTMIFQPRIYDYPRYGAVPNLGLAITQITLGCLCIIFNVAQICIYSFTAIIGVGIWGGVPVRYQLE